MTVPMSAYLLLQPHELFPGVKVLNELEGHVKQLVAAAPLQVRQL